MKTLKESLLSDIDTNLAQGDKWDKKFAAAQSELKYISDCINDFDPNSASPSKWYLWSNEYRKRATIFFKTPKLTKYFNLPGKHIFIQIIFDKYFHSWGVNVIFSNASKTTIDNKNNQMERVGSIRGNVLYTFKENGVPNDKASKFRMDEFIQTYVSPMFNSIESFKQYIVDPYDNKMPDKETII
jgi:hypothetical protein